MTTRNWSNWSEPFRAKKYAQTDEETVLRNLVDAFSSCPSFGGHYIVDIGAGDGYNLSNSALLMEQGWDAFRVDGRFGNPAIKLHQRWISAETICALLAEHNVPKSFGILTIDIDGVDLYVLDALLEGGYRPSIICFEFNGCRQPESTHVVAYDAAFKMIGDYYGASWGAFRHVLGLHGYTCVHHSHDMNGYAVDSVLGPVPCDTMPSYNQYHPRMIEGEWQDALTLFSKRA